MTEYAGDQGYDPGEYDAAYDVDEGYEQPYDPSRPSGRRRRPMAPT